jgi:hypothetical protein
VVALGFAFVVFCFDAVALGPDNRAGVSTRGPPAGSDPPARTRHTPIPAAASAVPAPAASAARRLTRFGFFWTARCDLGRARVGTPGAAPTVTPYAVPGTAS